MNLSISAIPDHNVCANLHKIQPAHKEVPFNQVEKVAKQIKEKYEISPYQYLFEHSDDELFVNTIKLHAETIFENIKKGAKIGFLVGGAAGITVEFFAGGQTAGMFTLKTTGIGTAVGAAIGMGIGAKKAYTIGKVSILQDEGYKLWRQRAPKEEYELFLHCLMNFSQDADYGNFICPLTHDIPRIPVKAPNGTVYDKEAIERHLDIQWEKIQAYRDSNYNEQQIQERMITICPMRSQPFRKEDLEYALDFSKEAIKCLRGLKDQLHIDADKDHILIKICKETLEHYLRTYNSVTAEIIYNLKEDLKEKGATDRQIHFIKRRYKNDVCIKI